MDLREKIKNLEKEKAWLLIKCIVNKKNPDEKTVELKDVILVIWEKVESLKKML